jgi:hypothetical protein
MMAFSLSLYLYVDVLVLTDDKETRKNCFAIETPVFSNEGGNRREFQQISFSAIMIIISDV